ncbi:hypothetical protein GQ42DRAFT_72192 [Ramicandelaber brevisporus]|nr:hypothetical protein GQ42DRAFT_72192 [Ramicandelaber brevisporus]
MTTTRYPAWPAPAPVYSAAYPATRTLPDGTHLVLRQASPAQTLALRRNAALAWKAFMTDDQYVRREELLCEQQPSTGRGRGYIAWVLVPADDPDTLDILAGCETFRRAAALAAAGDVSLGWAENLGGVFCPVAKRSNGYASIMIETLQTRVLSAQPGCVVGSVLCSKVGKAWYERFHWRSYANWRTHVAAPSPLVVADIAVPDGVRLLSPSDTVGVCQRDCELLLADLRAAATSSHSPRFLLLPDAVSFPWHWARYIYLAEASEFGFDEVIFWCETEAGLDGIADACAGLRLTTVSGKEYTPSLAVKEYENNVPGLAVYGAAHGSQSVEWMCNERHTWL